MREFIVARLHPTYSTWILGILCSFFLFPSLAKSLEISVSFQNTQPKYLIQGHHLSGLCFDIYKAIERRVKDKGITFKYPTQYLPLKRIFSDMSEGKIQLYCGAGRNNRRTKHLLYSDTPLYEVQNLITSRASDNTAANSLEDLVSDQAPVITLRGSSTEAFMRRQNVPIEPINPASVTQALKLVQLNRARYFIYHDLGLRYHIKKSFSKTDFKFGNDPIRRYNHWMVLSKHLDDETLANINRAITKMVSLGEIQSILKKYQ